MYKKDKLWNILLDFREKCVRNTLYTLDPQTFNTSEPHADKHPSVKPPYQIKDEIILKKDLNSTIENIERVAIISEKEKECRNSLEDIFHSCQIVRNGKFLHNGSEILIGEIVEVLKQKGIEI